MSEAGNFLQSNTPCSEDVREVGIVRPRNVDIICGRCKDALNHDGNRRFRSILKEYLPRYRSTNKRKEVSELIERIVRLLMEDEGLRFLKKSGSQWVEMDFKDAKKKTGHALRDMNSNQREVASKRARMQKQEIQITIPCRPEDEYKPPVTATYTFDAALVSDDDLSVEDNIISSIKPTFQAQPTGYESQFLVPDGALLLDDTIFEL